MAEQFPHRIFAGLSAATILHLEHGWHLHAGDPVFIASNGSEKLPSYRKLHRVYMRDPEVREVRYRQRGDGTVGAHLACVDDDTEPETIGSVRITSPARTLVDCGLRYEFADALPMFDSALRRGLVRTEDVLAICDRMRVDCGPVMRALHYADPASENGGESWCRAVVIEGGFVAPELQREFVDPEDDASCSRVDFLWRLPGGGIVVLEYDGMRKYVDPAMAKGRDIRQVVLDERAREEMLRRAGVTAVLRTDHDEVRRRHPLYRKLEEAGVPKSGVKLLYG
ncbi:CTP synthase [Bifidobacterium ramosum]|uniref:CTP synthase n=1 Tax=Bifidobacterium ramosum TaxID=1798158 RepID=A0A7K3TEE1_9BIFI|nr:CTP synthase [Bifidobacterium ramosum]